MSHTEISNPLKLVENPLVSVYMLAYKHEHFIAQAIESVISQKCDFDFELIVGEDNSPDGTLEIIASYQDAHDSIVRIITSDTNIGAHKNSFRCRHAARGKYIAICEGDDFWHDPMKLQMQVDLMEANPSMVLCHTDFDRLTRFGRKRNVHLSGSPLNAPAQGMAYESLLCTWSIMTATSMYRRDVLMDFMQSSFYSQEWPFGDRNLMLYSSLRGQIGYINESTATFRRTKGSSMNSGHLSQLRMVQATEDCVNAFLQKHPVSDDVALQARSILKRQLIKVAFFAGDVSLLDTCKEWLENNKQESPIYGSKILRWISATPFILRPLTIFRSFVKDFFSDR